VALTKVVPNIIAVANNVTNKTVGNTTSIPSFTFDGAGVVTSASNVAISGAGITANTVANSAFQTGSVENYLRGANLDFGMRNRIINGAMVFDQRNAGASFATNTGAERYTLDRWQAYYGSQNKYTVQRNAGSVTPPAGFTNYIGATSSSAYTVGASEEFSINQYIEGFNWADLNWGTASARPVTLSFWVRSSLTGTFGGALRNYAGNRSYTYSYTINSANTWEYKIVTIAGDTGGTWAGATNSGAVIVGFALGVGSSNSTAAGSWVAGNFQSVPSAVSVVGTNGATFYLTGVQIEEGSVPTPFEYRQYGAELALCQRYYEKSYAQATAVPTNAVSSYIVFNLGTNTYYGGATGDVSQNLNTAFFKVTKRANPTVTTYSYTSSVTGVASNGWTGADLAAGTATVAQVDTLGFNVYNGSGSNRTVNPGAVIVHFAASVEL
jgi:hypothetical protein